MQFTVNTYPARVAWHHYRAKVQADRDRFWAMAVDDVVSRPPPTSFFKKPSPLTTERINEIIHHETDEFGATGVFRDIQRCDHKIAHADRIIDDLTLLISAGVSEIVYDIDEFRPVLPYYVSPAQQFNGGRHADAA